MFLASLLRRLFVGCTIPRARSIEASVAFTCIWSFCITPLRKTYARLDTIVILYYCKKYVEQNKVLYLKVGCLHPVACTRLGSGFPSNATLV
jgi:hypothetical protein